MTVRRPPMAVLLACLLVAGLALRSAPAGAAEDRLQITEVDVSSHPTVSLVVTAPGQLATEDLSSAFSIREAGEPRQVSVDRIETDGLEVVVAIDTSGSMEGAPMTAARDAAKAFVGDLPASTPIAVIGFGAVPGLAAPFSTDRAATVAAIDGLVPTGETALYDAVLSATALPGAAKTRSLVVLSDGGDTVSTASLDEAMAAIAGSEVQTSIVELVSPESDHDALARMAEASGGRVIASADPAALRAAYRTVTADLIGRYRISFESTQHGPTDVAIGLRTESFDVATTKRLVLPGVAAAVQAPPVTTTADRIGLLQSDSALAAGGALIFVAMAVLLGSLLRPRSRTVRLGSGTAPAAPRTSVADIAKRASAAAERSLERREARGAIDAVLEQAGLALRAGELVVMVTVGAAAVGAAGLLLGGALLAVALAAATPLIARLVLTTMRDRRRRRFADHLDDLLQMVAGSLRAGYGLSQAIEAASREMESPVSDELRRVSTEVRLGRDLIDALDAMAVRVANEDFGWVVQAIRIHREVGGDLGEVLDRVAETIRARGRLHRQVRALSAEGRISAYVLVSLPFVIAGVMSVLNPGYLAVLYTTAIGFVLLAIATVLMAVGSLWLRKLIRPVY